MTPVLIYHSLLTSASRSSFSAMLCVLTQHLEFFFSSFVRYQFHRKPFRPRILFDMKFLQKGEIPKLWTFKCQVASSWGHRSVEPASAEVSSVSPSWRKGKYFWVLTQQYRGFPLEVHKNFACFAVIIFTHHFLPWEHSTGVTGLPRERKEFYHPNQLRQNVQSAFQRVVSYFTNRNSLAVQMNEYKNDSKKKTEYKNTVK